MGLFDCYRKAIKVTMEAAPSPARKLTDLDLAPSQRTLANFYEAEALKLRRELHNTSKGMKRLSNQNKALRKALVQCRAEIWRLTRKENV